MPKPEAIIREAVIVLGGALLAAFIIGRFPAVKAWVKDQWA
jgi:hypothetical protein